MNKLDAETHGLVLDGGADVFVAAKPGWHRHSNIHMALSGVVSLMHSAFGPQRDRKAATARMKREL